MDRRRIKRNETARVVRRPADLSLNRRIEVEEGPSEGLKAAIVAALTLGVPAPQIAQQFGLPPGTVREWAAAYDISNPIQRRDKLSEMLMAFIEQEISSLMTISIAISDENWIKQQPAGEIAQLAAMKQDRLMQILAAYSKAQAGLQQLKGEIEDGDN